MKGKKIVEKKGKLNEAALTDFYMNAGVDVEGLGSGKVVLITPDSVSVRFADDSEKTFLTDELYKLDIEAPEGEEGEGEGADAPADEPADLPAPDADLPLEGKKKEKKDKEEKELKENLKKLSETVAMLTKKVTKLSEADDNDEGEPAVDPQKAIDLPADKDTGASAPATADPDKADSIPAPITQELAAIKASLKKVIEAVSILNANGDASTASLKKVIEAVSKLVEADDEQEGEPAEDPQKAIDLKPNVPAGETVPAPTDNNQASSIPAPITAESRRKKALVKKLNEQKALAGIV